MEEKQMRKLQQLYVEDDLYMDVKGLATLKEQKIKTVFGLSKINL